MGYLINWNNYFMFQYSEAWRLSQLERSFLQVKNSSVRFGVTWWLNKYKFRQKSKRESEAKRKLFIWKNSEAKRLEIAKKEKNREFSQKSKAKRISL